MAGERHRATCWEREGHSCGKAPKERCTVALLVNVEEHHEGHVGATSRGSDNMPKDSIHLNACFQRKHTPYQDTHPVCSFTVLLGTGPPSWILFTEDPSVLSSPVTPSLSNSGLSTGSLSESEQGTGGHPWLSANAGLVWRGGRSL